MNESHLRFRRSKFATRIPRSRLYTEGHYWLGRDGECSSPPEIWRIGLTGFAIRMLGEPVEFDFEVAVGAEVEEGQVIGWIEGFKAVTDLYCPMGGRFQGANPALESDLSVVKKDPFGKGWFYRVEGAPPASCLDAEVYATFLGDTIDRMTANGSGDGAPDRPDDAAPLDDEARNMDEGTPSP